MTIFDGNDAMWAPLVERGSSACAPNIDAEACWLDVAGLRWRASCTRPRAGNCYVVSATGQYLDYARDEIRRLPSAFARQASRLALSTVAPILRALDPIVVLDALPVSTVLHAPRPTSAWRDALAAARATFPGRPVLVRSLDDIGSAPLLAALESLGLRRMLSRLVFYQDPRSPSFWRHRNLQHDLRMIDAQPMPWRALTPPDAEMIALRYWQLYGEKHSVLNPQFTPAWLSESMRQGALAGEGLLVDGQLAAVYLSYAVDDVMTNPVFGYELDAPASLGLYRRLSVRALQTAQRRGMRLHASSGAPGFKRSRGGVPALEYHMLDLTGVGGTQRMAWEAAIRLASRLGPTALWSAI